MGVPGTSPGKWCVYLRTHHFILLVYFIGEMAYAIRVTPREGTQDMDNVKKALDKIGGAHVACREFASSEHIHIVIWTQLDAIKVRNTFTNTLGKTGNGVLSIKVAKDDKGAMRYACKGDKAHPEKRGNPPDVVWHYGLTVYKTVPEAYEAYWAMSKEIKETPGLTFPTQVEHYMKQANMEFTAQTIASAMVDLCIQKKNQINEFYLAGVGKLILAKNNRNYKSELVQQLAKRIQQDG